MEILLAAIAGSIATVLVGAMVTAPVEVRRRDLQIQERDERLEEWILERDRRLVNDLTGRRNELAAKGLLESGATVSGQAAIRAELLYAYREEVRQAKYFVRGLVAEERWSHSVWRFCISRPMPSLRVPQRAAPLIDEWEEGTRRNALTWTLAARLDEISRAPSRAADPDAPRH